MSNADMDASEVLPDSTVEPSPSVGDNGDPDVIIITFVQTLDLRIIKNKFAHKLCNWIKSVLKLLMSKQVLIN